MNESLYFYVPLIGFLVGGLVASTGVGGGVLLLPILIIGLRVPPIVAVGSDVVFMFLTKLWAVVLHWRRSNVDWQLAIALALGSVPGELAGVGLLAFLRFSWGAGVNSFLRALIGVLLVVLPIVSLVIDRIKLRRGASLRDGAPLRSNRYKGAVLIGLVGGFLVGLTSVGSGSVIMLLLMLFYRRAPAVLVGTDIFNAMILTGVTGIVHLKMGTVDARLVAGLMVGSVAGVLLGAKLTTIVPSIWLRRAVLLLLITAGIKML